MNAVSAYVAVAAAAAMLIVGAVAGYWIADYFSARAIDGLNKQLSQAHADTAVAVASVASVRAALTTIKEKYADLERRHEAMRTLSETELAARQSRIDQLKSDAAKRQATITEKSHDQDCADLDRLPLCPAIADQLWTPAAEAAGSDADRSD